MNFMGKTNNFHCSVYCFLVFLQSNGADKTGEDAFDVGQYAVAVQYLEKRI